MKVEHSGASPLRFKASFIRAIARQTPAGTWEPMLSPHLKKRLWRYCWRLSIAVAVLIVTAPLTLPLLLSWMCESILVTQSSRGHTVSVVETNFIGRSAVVFSRQDGALAEIVNYNDDNGPNLGHAFWSQDGALFVLRDESDKLYLVFDCGKNIVYGTRKGKPLLKSHGGIGTLIFDGWRDLEARSRHLWPWEKSAADGNSNAVPRDPEIANGG